MSNLKFAETQNLVAFLEKPEESDGFEGIIDFLNASSIRYALTVNPTIYTSCIKQFWATTKAKTVNGEVQIQALVDGKKVIVTKTSIRRALQLKDVEVLRLLPGMNLVALWAQLSSVLPQTKNLTFPKEENVFQEEGEGSEMPTVPHYTSTINQPSSPKPLKKQKPRKTKKQNTKVSQPSDPIEPMADETENVESVPIHSNDPLLSGTKRLRKVGRSAQVVSSEDEGLGAQEDASKQGRKIVDLDADAEEVKVEKLVNTAEVTTTSATTTTVNELTLAQTLRKIKATKPKVVTTAATITTIAVTRPKARGVVVQEPSEFRTTTSSLQTSQLPQVKDKGKAKIIEPEKPLKKKDQILVDEEIAQRLQEELQAELEKRKGCQDKKKKRIT
ncbi:hypothetical protein Tco_1052392 [Tanacetum coccineum]